MVSINFFLLQFTPVENQLKNTNKQTLDSNGNKNFLFIRCYQYDYCSENDVFGLNIKHAMNIRVSFIQMI